jgi:hypothetical protein
MGCASSSEKGDASVYEAKPGAESEFGGEASGHASYDSAAEALDRDVDQNRGRRDSVAELTEEPSALSSSLKQKYLVTVARLRHGVTADVNQYTLFNPDDDSSEDEEENGGDGLKPRKGVSPRAASDRAPCMRRKDANRVAAWVQDVYGDTLHSFDAVPEWRDVRQADRRRRRDAKMALLQGVALPPIRSDTDDSDSTNGTPRMSGRGPQSLWGSHSLLSPGRDGGETSLEDKFGSSLSLRPGDGAQDDRFNVSHSRMTPLMTPLATSAGGHGGLFSPTGHQPSLSPGLPSLFLPDDHKASDSPSGAEAAPSTPPPALRPAPVTAPEGVTPRSDANSHSTEAPRYADALPPPPDSASTAACSGSPTPAHRSPALTPRLEAALQPNLPGVVVEDEDE